MNENTKEFLIGHGGFFAAIWANVNFNSVLAALVSVSWIIYIWKKILRKSKKKNEEDTDL